MKVIKILSFVLLLACTILACAFLGGSGDPAQPEPTPIPGWQLFEGEEVELWLPDSFEGGNLEEDLPVVVDALRSLGPNFIEIAATIENNPEAFAIWAFDSQMGSPGFLTNVNITREQVLSVVSLDDYMDAVSRQLGAGFEILSQEKTMLNGSEAGVFEITLQLPEVKAHELVYIIKEGNTMYALTYATHEDEWARRRPVFEQSAQTFRVTP
jgi:hypothetical protein